jgi:hypothetical protein
MNLVSLPMNEWPTVFHMLASQIDNCQTREQANLKLLSFIPLKGFYSTIIVIEDKPYLGLFVELEVKHCM